MILFRVYKLARATHHMRERCGEAFTAREHADNGIGETPSLRLLSDQADEAHNLAREKVRNLRQDRFEIGSKRKKAEDIFRD